MTEGIVQFFLDLFSGITSSPLGKEITVFVISAMPILELRGGLLAATFLNMNPWASFLICFIGNIIPIPLIMYLITPLFDRLKKTKRLSKLVLKLENKANKKKDQIEKYKYWGLLIFVGIPLPGTGAWTGCLIASLLGMDKKKSCLAAVGGVLMAGIIMMIISFGIIGNLF